MAARTLYPAQSAPMNWSASTWALSDGGTENEPKPINGDSVAVTVNSNTLTLDEDSAYLAAFTMSGGTIEGSSLRSIKLQGSVAITGGALSWEGQFIMFVSGNFASSVSVGCLTIAPGATVTVTGTSYLHKLSGEGTISPATTQYLYFYPTPVDNFWDFTGVCNARVFVSTTGSISTGLAITLANVSFEVRKGSVTADGPINVGTADVTVAQSATATLTMGAYGLTANDLTLGKDGAAYDATADLGSGTHALAGAIGLDTAPSGTMTIAWGSSTTVVVGAVDLTGIVSTADGASVETSGMTLDSTGAADGSLTVNAGGLSIIGPFTMQETAGTTTAAGAGDTDVAGDLLILAGDLTNSGMWTHSASGDVSNASSARKFAHLRLGWGAGVASTLTDDVCCQKFEYGDGGGTVGGAKWIYVYPSANDWWTAASGAGSLTVSRVAFYDVADGQSLANPVDVSGCSLGLTIQVSIDATATISGDINCGAYDFVPRCAGLGMGTLNLTGNLIAGGWRLGATAAGGYSITLNLGAGSHQADTVAKNCPAEAGSVLGFATCTLTLSDTLDGTGLTPTNTGATVIGGTITDLDLSSTAALLHLFPATLGSGNQNVNETYLTGGPSKTKDYVSVRAWAPLLLFP